MFAGGFDSVVTNMVGAVVSGARPRLQVGSPNCGRFAGLAGYSA